MLAPRVQEALPEGSDVPVVLGIRPEYVYLEGGSPGVHGRVDEVELLGSERVVWVTVGAGTRMALRVSARVRAAPGDRLHAGFDPKAIRLFDAVSGLLLV